MMNIILLGLPGSGKSTHGKKIAEKYGLYYLESGEIFRKKAKKDTETGRELKKYLNQGKLVPDATVKEVMAQEIEENIQTKGFVFDGFPRTSEQAQFLDKLLQEKGTSVHIIIHLKINKDQAKKRIVEKRRKEEDRVEDKSDELVENRIKNQEETIRELTEYYEKRIKPFEYDATGTIEIIQEAIDEVISMKQDNT